MKPQRSRGRRNPKQLCSHSRALLSRWPLASPGEWEVTGGASTRQPLEVLRSVFPEYNRWGGYRARESRYSASCLPTGYPPRVNFRNHIACQESLLQVSRIRACSGYVVASCRCTNTCDRYNVTVKLPLHVGSTTAVTGRYNTDGFRSPPSYRRQLESPWTLGNV